RERRLKDQARPHLDAPDSGDDGTLSDERILARFVSGDEEALGELARRYEGLLLGLCTGMLGDRALAMEAVQETWLRVIRHSRTYDGRASVKTWVYQIAMNRCRDLGRSRSASKKRERVHHDRLQDEKKAHVIPTASPVDPRLEAAVGALEEHQRETVILCYHRGLTHRQAAEVLGVPMGTIKSRLNKALEKLRESLGTQDAVPGRGVEA
ncbi:MAG: RNA polymerase sigma factor, partial [Phycisphaerales bacterium JB061]